MKARKIKNNKGSGSFTVEVDGAMKTSFMKLAGISDLDLTAISEVKRGSSGPLEMVLALDTTYSMSANGKIDTLKTAATDLVNTVMAGGNVKVGVAPFADYFNVGVKYKGEPWLDIPPPSSGENCDYSYPDKKNCRMQTSTCYADGVPYSCTAEVCEDWGTAVKGACYPWTSEWSGCVAARPEAYHASIADAMTVPYPGRNWGCGTPMLALTDVKTDVLATIDALSAVGRHPHPLRLMIWAWNMVTPEAPLTEAMPQAEAVAKGGKKVVVLMTDGANSSSPYDDGNYGPDASTKYGDNGYSNSLTAKLCESIKAEGTVVYTVLFDVSDPQIEALLRGCASDASKSYVAGDKAALLTAFNDIGAALTKLRLTK